jgi:hypothetical protein
VDEVLLRGLAEDPTEDWPSCGALLGALEPALGISVPAAAHSEARRRLRLPITGAPLVAAAGVVLVAALLVTGLGLRLRSADPAPAEISLPPPVSGLLPGGELSPPSGGAARSRTSGTGAPAMAISLSATVVGRGAPLGVSGVGFDPHGLFLITLDQGGARYQLLGLTPSPASGSFSVQVFIPGQATPGLASINACATAANGRVERCVRQRVSIAT